eukprot:jgi/Chlat1/7847/Chrsp66S07276
MEWLGWRRREGRSLRRAVFEVLLVSALLRRAAAQSQTGVYGSYSRQQSLTFGAFLWLTGISLASIVLITCLFICGSRRCMPRLAQQRRQAQRPSLQATHNSTNGGAPQHVPMFYFDPEDADSGAEKHHGDTVNDATSELKAANGTAPLVVILPDGTFTEMIAVPAKDSCVDPALADECSRSVSRSSSSCHNMVSVDAPQILVMHARASDELPVLREEQPSSSSSGGVGRSSSSQGGGEHRIDIV